MKKSNFTSKPYSKGGIKKTQLSGVDLVFRHSVSVCKKVVLASLFLFSVLFNPIQTNAQEEVQAISNYLDKLVSAAALENTDAAEWVITNQHVSSISQIHHIYYRQKHQNIEVHGANSSIHLFPNGDLLKTNDGFVKHLSSKISSSPVPGLTAIQAIEAAAKEMKYALKGNFKVLEEDRLNNSLLISKGGISLEDIPAKLMYVKSGDQYTLAWNISIYELDAQNWWEMRVDANTGRIIDKNNWVTSCDWSESLATEDYCPEDHIGHRHTVVKEEPNKAEEAHMTSMVGAYRVYPIPVESPDHGARSLILNPDDPIASPFGWHDTNGVAGPESTLTIGNNVLASEDTDGNNIPGFSPNGGGGLLFDFPLDLSMHPNTNFSPNITNLFFWNNVIHDMIYHYGFDEASGNFQENNYGNGGLGSDNVNADAQNPGNCNANFATPTDGNNPRMQMFICNNSAPPHDGDLDNLVIVHEYAHGISIRLTGGAGNSGCLSNQEQMGEGWSDYYGVMMTMLSTDNATVSRPVGTYLFGQPVNGPGIRPFPYNTNLAVNPQTYDHIKTAAVPHGVGSVWCTMLWEMTWEIMNTVPFDPDLYYGTGGNNIALALVTEALKIQPCSPGFVDGRDAILAADVALYGGAYQCEIWTAFAKRGLGQFANQGSTGNRSDGTEDFTIPPGVCGAVGNEVCSSALPINCGNVITGSTIGVASDVAPFCGTSDGTGGGLWYTFVGDGSCVRLSTCNAVTNYDTKIRVYTGTCLALVCESGNDDDFSCGFNTLRSTVNFQSQVGVNYYVLVHGFGSNEGTFQLDFQCNPYLPLTVTCPADLNLTCGTPIPAPANSLAAFQAQGGSIMGGSCQPSSYTITSMTTESGDQCDGSVAIREYTVTNNISGDVETCTQTINVAAPAAPMVTCPPDITVACEDDINLDPNNATVITDCGLGFAIYIKNPLGSGVPGCSGTIYEYIYKVVDDCGNQGQCSQFVTIDNAPASITPPAGGTVDCFEDVSISVDDATVTNECASYNLYLLPAEINGGKGCPGATYTYTYRLVDACGEIVEEDVVFTNAANPGPTISAPADISTTCLASLNPNPNLATVVTSCNADATVTISGPQIIGAMDCPGTQYRYTYTVTDACGRTASDIQTYTVANSAPVFENCPEDNWLILNCEDYGGEGGTIQVIQAWMASVTAKSSCGTPLTVLNNFNANNINTCVNNGFNTVTFRATDNCGRTTFCTGIYVVVDTEAPIVTTEAQDHYEMCNFNTQANLTAWVQSRAGAEAFDGCSDDNISWQASPANPQINCGGAIGTTSVTVQFIVTDNCGNKTTTSATFNALASVDDFWNGDDANEVEAKDDKAIVLLQNRPNPFKDETLISFKLPESSRATLTIYDINGRTLKVVEGNFNAGYNEVSVNASDLGGSGIMYYRLMTENSTLTKTMLVID